MQLYCSRIITHAKHSTSVEAGGLRSRSKAEVKLRFMVKTSSGDSRGKIQLQDRNIDIDYSGPPDSAVEALLLNIDVNRVK